MVYFYRLFDQLCVRLYGAAGRLPSDNAGGVMVVFGLLLVPLALLAGGALDYSRASNAKAELSRAGDAAVLVAVTPEAMLLPPAEAERRAAKAFDQLAAIAKFPRDIVPTFKVSDVKGRRTAEVRFTANVPTTLMRLAGVENIPIAEDSVASSAMPVYMDFYLLLDNTPSMGVGATPADVATMVNNTPDKCAFACHDLSSGGKDYYALAKKLQVTMRIDVVRQATQRLMDTATASAVAPRQFRAAVYTSGDSCSALGLNTISPLTPTLSSVKRDADKIDLMTIPFQNFNNDQCTDYDTTFIAVDRAISSPGDGSSPARPQKVLFFVSDGVADAFYPSNCTKPTTGGRCQEPIKVANCKALKDRGIKVAVLYTTYLPLPTNAWYNTWISPFASQIGTRMEECASPGLYFEVSPTQGISQAMEALFQRAVNQARLTN